MIRTPVLQNCDKVKRAELQLAVSMTCHCAIKTIDHLTDIVKTHGEGSTLCQIRLQRTKCSCLIKNVVSPALKCDLIEDLKNKKYAIIIDESTDVAIQKHLCLLVHYFSDKRK